MAGSVKRHPVRGLLSGLFLGIGISLLLLSYGIAFAGTATPFVPLVVLPILGVAWSLVAPVPGGGAAAAAAAGLQPPPAPPPPA